MGSEERSEERQKRMRGVEEGRSGEEEEQVREPGAELSTETQGIDMYGQGAHDGRGSASANGHDRQDPPLNPAPPPAVADEAEWVEGKDERMRLHVQEAWEWFRSVGSPKFWLAPMVGHSDPAFRMLARKHGVHICHTEMIDAGGYARREAYRLQYPFCEQDRPLVVQLGGSDVSHLAQAASLAAPHCDAVELNVGCPQRCARQGGYGAYLMDTPDHLRACVEAMASAIRGANPKCACLVKIRCFEEMPPTVVLARMLVAAGCHCLTVHGRTRRQGGGKRTGKWPANWDWIREVKQALPIPVISNGNVRHHEDLLACLSATGCDGVMSGCGALKRPFIFSPAPEGPLGFDAPRRISACVDYARLAIEHPPYPKQMSKHFIDVIPAGVLRLEAMRPLSQAIKDLPTEVMALTKGTGNADCPEALVRNLESLLERCLEAVVADWAVTGPLPGEDSDEEDSPAGQGGAMSG